MSDSYGSTTPGATTPIYVSARPLRSRRDSTASNASFYSDVEMAQDEIYAGPTSESMPSSAASFIHRRRPRTDSVTSWSFFEPGTEDHPVAGVDDEDAVLSDDDDLDLEAAYSRRSSLSSQRRKSSNLEATASDPLIRRQAPGDSSARLSTRTSQTIYITTEDLTIAVAGFTTSKIGYAAYLVISWVTLGFGWLVLRWFPRARVRLIGKRAPLGLSSWVVVEVCSRNR